MCNLHSITTNEAAIIALFRVVNRYVGNLAPMPGVFPDYSAPIVRTGAEGRVRATARWGMPSSQQALMEATKKRAAKLESKGKPVDFKQLLRMESAETWLQYGPLFRTYSTSTITPELLELLAALAQIESSGNPVART